MFCHLAGGSAIGLDFGNAGDFTELLKKRIDGDQFYADGMEVSVNTGAIKKFAYMPTADHRYLFEVGVNLQDNSLFQNFNFLDVSQSIINRYSVVKDITVYSHDGYALGKQGEDGKALRVGNQQLPVLQEAYETQRVAEQELAEGGEHVTYRFVPYKADESSQDLSRSRVIEIVYDNNELDRLLSRNDQAFWLKLLIAAAAALAVSFFIGRMLTRPIAQMGRLIDTAEQYNGDAAYFNTLLTEFSASFEQLYASISSTASATEQLTDSIGKSTRQVEVISAQSRAIVEKQSGNCLRLQPKRKLGRDVAGDRQQVSPVAPLLKAKNKHGPRRGHACFLSLGPSPAQSPAAARYLIRLALFEHDRQTVLRASVFCAFFRQEKDERRIGFCFLGGDGKFKVAPLRRPLGGCGRTGCEYVMAILYRIVDNAFGYFGLPFHPVGVILYFFYRYSFENFIFVGFG